MNTQTVTSIEWAKSLVEGYIAAWNERDATCRRALIAKSWTEDATYLDPLMLGEGHTEIDAMIQAVQERFADYRFYSLNNVDTHNNQLRFSWKLAPESGEMLVGGTDFATISKDGRLQNVVGFLDHVPAPK